VHPAVRLLLLLRAHAADHGGAGRQSGGRKRNSRGAGDRRQGHRPGDRVPAHVRGAVRHLLRELMAVPDTNDGVELPVVCWWLGLQR